MNQANRQRPILKCQPVFNVFPEMCLPHTTLHFTMKKTLPCLCSTFWWNFLSGLMLTWKLIYCRELTGVTIPVQWRSHTGCLEYEFCWIYLRPALDHPKPEFSLGQVWHVRVGLSASSIPFGSMALPPKLPAGIGLLASISRVVFVWWTVGRWHEVPWHSIATKSINSAHTNINLVWMIASVIKEFQFIKI